MSTVHWPNDGSGRTLLPSLFLDIGALCNSEVRVSSTSFHSDMNFFPGPIQYLFAQDSISNPKYRTYKIQSNYESLFENEIKDALRRDYEEWPVELGAPIDSAGNPQFLGYQTTWMINNDTVSATRSSNGSRPLFVELRTTSWSFANDDVVLRNAIGVRQNITNRHILAWTDAYVGQRLSYGLSSPQYSTYAGTDSTIGLVYFYHSEFVTSTYYGKQIPAIGYVLLQGPLKDESGSRGLQSGSILGGKKNISASSIIRHLIYSNPVQTPVRFRRPNSYTERYNSLRGLWNDGTPIVDPHTNHLLNFAVPGDPIKGIGWTDVSENTQPYFRDAQLNVGPFDLAPGESQEVVGALIVGQGRDRLQSINVLKHHARYVKSAYPFLFGAGLPSPTVNASSLGGKVFLTWDNNAEKELPPLSTYKFQGYY
ncbi:MAG: hypothetical protein ACYC09_12600, partial [Bacteroidota bacterium]